MLNGKERPAPPGPSYMSDEQKAQYLDDLRRNRSARPIGSRPPPPSRFPGLRRTETEAPVAPSAPGERPSLLTGNSLPVVPSQKSCHQRAGSDAANRSPFAGRAVARPPSATPPEATGIVAPSNPQLHKMSSMQYRDSGTRRMEKQEARSLRIALEDMDLEEQKKIHDDAQDEAAELVWKHRNPDDPAASTHVPYCNPDIQPTPKDHRYHLRQGSYQQMHNQRLSSGTEQRQTSAESKRSTYSESTRKEKSTDTLRKISPAVPILSHEKARTPSGKSYGGLAEAVADDIAKAKRRASSGSKRIMSGDKRFYMHPNDKIWEDPVESPKLKEMAESPKSAMPPQASQPSYVRKNPFARVRMQAEQLERSRSEPMMSAPMHNRVEIQRNPPSQSKNPWYMSNVPLSPTPPSPVEKHDDNVAAKTTPTPDGRERRSDDIRAATSKQRSQYSPNLPRPTMVSNKPGRPIVSFVDDTKPKEIVLEEQHSVVLPESTASEHSISARASSLPHAPPPLIRTDSSYHFPKIGADDSGMPPIPVINFPDDPETPGKTLSETPDLQEVGAASSIRSGPLLSRPSGPVKSASEMIQPSPPNVHVSDTSAPPRASASRSPFGRPQSNFKHPPSSPQPPKINVSDLEDPKKRNTNVTPRPLPSHSGLLPTTSRPFPRHAASCPIPKSSPHYTPGPRISQTGVLCAHCALPIAGRVLSAAGFRFHPECFTCHTCETNLELVAFYPEPERQRDDRLSRLHALATGSDIPIPDDNSAIEIPGEDADGTPTPRFYCHLDFHETFSPRCKSCQTPIEGEVIVACGAEYHVGHFFCAQCGDPFDSSTPFVEKDGYAWCTGCHVNRYSSKCRKCRKPVTDTVVKALGADWHQACFVCLECNGEFMDGRYFLRGDLLDPVCVRCEERRLKA